MLPTLGLFRIVPCPYYIAGLCDRPNCCFRHCRSDVEAARREAAGLDVADKEESEPEDAETPSVSAVDNKSSTDPPKVLNSPTLEPFHVRSRFNEEGQEKAIIRVKSFDSLTVQPASTNSVNFEDKKLFGISNPPSKLFISNDGASLKRPNDSTSDGEIGNNIKRIKLEEQEQPQRSTFCNIKTEKTDFNVSKKSFDDDDDDVIILSSGSEGGSPEKQINIKLEKVEKPDDSKPSTKSHKSRDRDSDRSSKDSGCDKPHNSRKSDEHRTNSSSSSSSHKNKKDRKDSRPSSSHSSRHSGEVRRSSDSSSKSTSKHKEKDKSKEPHSSSSKRSHSSKDKKSHSAKHSSKQEKSRESSKSHNHHKKNGSCTENSNSTTSNGDSKASKHKNKIESRKSSSVGENVKDDEEIGMRRSSLTLSYSSFHDDGDGDDNLNIFEPLDNDNDADNNADDFLFPSDEEDDPDEIAAECFQLFQEYKSDDSSVQAVSLETVPEPFLHRPADLESDPFGKKRVAHAGAIRSFLEKPLPPKRKETANEQLIKRMQQAKASAMENANSNSNNVNASFGYSQNHPVPPPSVVSTSSVGGANLPNKRRIAHCSNASALVKPPQAPQSRTTPGGFPSSSSALQPARNANGVNSAFSASTSFTTSQTVAKGERRQAHTPVVNNISSAGPSPTIIPDSRSKVPVVIRQKFLDQIYRECLQVYTDRETASTRALEEEKGLIAKCNSKQVYSCSATNLITRLRKQYRESTSEIGGGFTTAGSTKTVSHNDILAGKSGNISWSVEKTKTVSNPVGVPLYTRMKDYLMSASELIDNGYPRKCAETYRGCSGIAVIKVREDSSSVKRATTDDPMRKVCDRCSASFLVTEEGFPRSKETCTYHTGRRFGRRTRTGNSDTRYNCCDGEPNSIGCCTAPCHVFTTKTADDLRNFISAALEAGDADTMGTHPWDIIAVDCEMVYTTHGTELARATFVGQDGKILYDTYVKPSHPVLDYNTRYSGIDASMIENTMTSISEVHLKILANLRPNSIIIGHSLENDLIALKLIHGCVIDTSLVYPHKRGLPFKRALRNLSSDYLGKIIQTGDAGHDSAEDARAALDLVLWKVKSDASKFAKRLSVSEQP